MSPSSTLSPPRRPGPLLPALGLLCALCALSFCSLGLAPRAQASGGVTYYVATTGSDSGNGGQGSPYATIGHALFVAHGDANGGNGDTVLVADGAYDEYDLTTEGMAITVKSQNGPQNCIIDSQGKGTIFFIDSGETSTTVLQGLTLENGASDIGGALYISGTSPTLTDCVFTDNSAGNDQGGAIYMSGGSPTLTDCAFTGNSGENGGALCLISASPVVTGCTFTDNTDDGNGGNGGAVDFASGNSAASFTDCVFTGNSAVTGGAVCDPGAGNSDTPTFTNCVFAGNFTEGGGGFGGALFYADPSLSLLGCTFSANSADGGTGGAVYCLETALTVTDSVLYGDTAANGPELYPEGHTPTLSHDDIDDNTLTTGTAGHPDGNGNFDADPQFATPYTSSSAPFSLAPVIGSPVQGAGVAESGLTADIAGVTRPDPPTIGAYEPVPVAPTTLTAAANTTSQIVLSWTASTTPGVFYYVYRGTKSGGEAAQEIAHLIYGQTTYTDSSPDYGQTDYYVVRAEKNGALSAPTNEASAAATLTAPPAPTALGARGRAGSVFLSWKAPAGPVSGYNVFRSTASGQEDPATATPLNGATPVTALTYTDSTATNGLTYYYKVVATNASYGAGGGPGPASNEASATPEAAPTAPTVTPTAGNDLVSLSWTSAGSGVTYRVLRGTSPGAETAISSATTGLTFKDSGAHNGTPYYYKVVATNVGGSATSTEVSATPVINAPVLNTLKAVSNGLKLGWTAPAGKVTSYTVSRGTSPGQETTLAGGLTSPLYTDSTAVVGTTYYYTVTAVNGAASSAPSNEKSGKR